MKCERYHDNFQNFKRYNIPKAQLVIADIPYNIGVNAYASNPKWYIDGDNRKGESDKAGKTFFHDVVIDPCAGSGSTLRAAYTMGRNAYGFEISKEFCGRAKQEMLSGLTVSDKQELAEQPSLFDLMEQEGREWQRTYIR